MYRGGSRNEYRSNPSYCTNEHTKLNVGLGLQNTTGSGNPSPGYACIQGSEIVHALSGLTRLPQA